MGEQKVQDQVLEFIERRWREYPSNWTTGNCYWFAHILCTRFPQLEIFYLPTIGHFVAGDSKQNRFYDWEGIFIPEETPINFAELLYKDPTWYGRLLRDCRD